LVENVVRFSVSSCGHYHTAAIENCSVNVLADCSVTVEVSNNLLKNVQIGLAATPVVWTGANGKSFVRGKVNEIWLFVVS
jgi:hypothetical protein